MTKKSNLVIEHDFHPQTLEELQTLKEIRLALAKKQLANIDETLDQLVARGLIQITDRTAARKELEQELLQRVKDIEFRHDKASTDIFLDEISLYVDLI